MNSNRVATAVVAASGAGSPAKARNTASRTPAPAGTGTARKPATQESTAANITRGNDTSGVSERATA